MIRWSESFRIGVEAIDSAHRDMLRVVNDIESAIQDKNYELASTLVGELFVISSKHFKDEEKYLEAVGYPDLKGHIEYHAELLSRAEAVRERCDEGRPEASVKNCYEELASFFIDDVIRGDMEYKSFLQEKGFAK
jgi:hemerythrin